MNTELTPKQFIEKGKRLDLYLEASDSYVDIEVTNNYEICIINRNLAYECRIYIDTVSKGIGYEQYKKVKSINLIGNKTSKVAKRIGYLKDENGNVMSKMLLYSEIYIDNLVKMYYNKDEVGIEKNKYLIMLGLNLEELIKFNQEYGDEIVEEYLEKFKEVSIIEEFEPLFTKEEDEKRIRDSIALSKYKDGLKQGINHNKTEIAKNMLAKGYDIASISDITGLSVEEINNLK